MTSEVEERLRLVTAGYGRHGSQWVKQLERRRLKNQGFNGIRTRDLRDTGAMLYQLSYEATHWERGQFIEFISPVRSEMMLSI